MMRSKFTVIGLLLLVLSLPGAAAAQEELPGEPIRLAGEIAAIDGSTLTVDTLAGEQLLVSLSEDTKFRSLGGEIQSVEDLEIGMKLVVLGSKQGDVVFARVVAVGSREQINRFDRFRGEVTGVNANTRSFTVENREGQVETFSTSEETKFHSRSGEFDGFDDLAAGQHVAVISSSDDGNTALRVLLLPDFDGERPRLEIRVRGEIKAISERNLVVESSEGDRYPFLLTDQTKIKRIGEGGIQVGDKVLVAGFENEDGDNIAVIVVARPTLDRDLRDRLPLDRGPEPVPEAVAPGDL